MKKKDDELKRQAYMDDQLSVDEIIEFEQGLDNKDKAEIQGEKEFEEALSERFKEDAGCPDSLWAETKARMAYHSKSRFHLFTFPSAFVRWGAAAVVFLFFSVTFLVVDGYKTGTSTDIPLEFPDNLREFSRFAEIPGNFEVVRPNLEANGFFVNLKNPDPSSPHDIQLLGVRYRQIDNQEVAQLFFSCCMRPVIVFLSKGPLDFRNRIIQANGQQYKSIYKAYSNLENYRILIFGPHPPNDILDLFS